MFLANGFYGHVIVNYCNATSCHLLWSRALKSGLLVTKNSSAPATGDSLAPVKRPRGRPKKGGALSPAEKQSRYRNSYRAALGQLRDAVAAYDAGEADAVPRLLLQVRLLLERAPR